LGAIEAGPAAHLPGDSDGPPRTVALQAFADARKQDILALARGARVVGVRPFVTGLATDAAVGRMLERRTPPPDGRHVRRHDLDPGLGVPMTQQGDRLVLLGLVLMALSALLGTK